MNSLMERSVDWPGIMQGFHNALKPGGWLYLTAEVPEAWDVKSSCERSKAMGLPVLYGGVADDLEASYKKVMSLHSSDVKTEIADASMYHYHPLLDQVRTWLDAAGLGLVEQRSGHWYEHIIVSRK